MLSIFLKNSIMSLLVICLRKINSSNYVLHNILFSFLLLFLFRIIFCLIF